MKKQEIKKGKIVIYKAKDGPRLDVRIKEETVWLSLNQIANLFDTDKSGISRHVKNIFQTRELKKDSTVAKIATVQNEGTKPIQRQIEFFNLNAIISVGYREIFHRGHPASARVHHQWLCHG